jgi:hypothetical protein
MKILRWVAIGLLALLALIQFIPPVVAWQTNPPLFRSRTGIVPRCVPVPSAPAWKKRRDLKSSRGFGSSIRNAIKIGRFLSVFA